MAKRRANNEGTIYKMKSDEWRAQVLINYERMEFIAYTQKECREWVKKIRRQIDQGLISCIIKLKSVYIQYDFLS